MKKRLGELLLERNLIDVDQLNAALGHQRQWGIRLGAALVAKGFIAEGTLMKVLSEALGIPMVDLSKVNVDPKALALVPARMCELHEVFPLAVKEAAKGGRRTLLIAMADPLRLTAIDEIAFTTDCTVTAAIAQTSSLDDMIQRHYHGQKREIAPLNFQGGIAPSRILGDSEHTSPGRRAPASSAGPTSPFMDFSDERSAEPVVLGVSLIDNKDLPASDPLAGQPTGAFAVVRSDEGPPAPLEKPARDAVAVGVDQEAVEALEKKFWALMRVLTRRGLVTKDEFLAELAMNEAA
jgi:hypothetical protein